MTTRVFIQAEGGRVPTDEELVHIDRFVAAFLLKKGGPPAGHWRVPGVGYCVFYKDRAGVE